MLCMFKDACDGLANLFWQCEVVIVKRVDNDANYYSYFRFSWNSSILICIFIVDGEEPDIAIFRNYFVSLLA